MEGRINVDKLERLFYKGDLRKQYFIKSETAFNLLKYEGYEIPVYTKQMLSVETAAKREVLK